MKKITILSLIYSTALFAANTGDEFFKEAEKGTLLNSTVVSTTGFETEQRNIGNTVTVITAEEIENKNYQNVSEILKDIPSVNIIGDPKAPLVDMRGQGSSSNSNVQILIDGIAVNLLDTSHANTPLNTVAVENIERIEVIPGGGAILYGSGTRGGIVNIITKSGAGKKGGSVRGEITSFGGKELDASYGTNLGNFGINFNYNHSDYKGFRDGDELKGDTFYTTIKYKIDDNQNISLKYSHHNSDSTSPRALTKDLALSNPESDGLIGKYDELVSNKTEKNGVDLIYNAKLGSKTDLEVTGFYQKIDILNINNYDYRINGKSFGMAITNSMDFTDEKLGVKPKLKFGYRDSDQLIIGYDHIHNKLNRDSEMKIFSKEYYENKLSKTTNSIFALNRNSVGNFEFTQGMRYENAKFKIGRGYKSSSQNTTIEEKRDMDNFAYELVGNYLYSDSGNIYAKLENGFTSPTPSQLVDKIGGVYIPNSLKSEKYRTYEIGLKDYILGSVVNGALFYTESRDEIATENYTGMNFKNFNIGKTKRVGAELNLYQNFGKLTLKEGYSYINTEILEDSTTGNVGNEIANVPKNKLNIGFDYEIIPALQFSWNTRYQSAVFLNNGNTGGKQNSSTVTDIAMNYKATDNIKLFAGVNNLFDKRYYDSISSTGTEYSPAGERMYTGGFKYDF